MRRINTRSSRPVRSMEEGLKRWSGKSPLDALTEIGADFIPVVAPAYAKVGETEIAIPNKMAVLNPLNNACLGIVSEGWRPMHNRVTAESIQQLAEAMEMPVRLTNAYNVNGGMLVGLEARIGDNTEIVPGDDVIPIVKIVQGNGGNSPLAFMFELMRLVCSNGMRAPVEGMSAIFRCKHTKHIETRYSWNFDSVLKNFSVMRDNMIEKFRTLAAKTASEAEARAFFNEIAKNVKGDKDDKADQTIADLVDVWNHPRQTMAGRNYWALLNSATEYLQHYGFRSDSQMQLQNINGSAVRMKDEAFRLAVAMAV